MSAPTCPHFLVMTVDVFEKTEHELEAEHILTDLIVQLGGMCIFRMAFDKMLCSFQAPTTGPLRAELILAVHRDLLAVHATGNNVTHVRVRLELNDTYTVAFMSGTEVIEEEDDVYCDVLRDVVERGTGLALVMPRLIRVSQA